MNHGPERIPTLDEFEQAVTDLQKKINYLEQKLGGPQTQAEVEQVLKDVEECEKNRLLYLKDIGQVFSSIGSTINQDQVQRLVGIGDKLNPMDVSLDRLRIKTESIIASLKFREKLNEATELIENGIKSPEDKNKATALRKDVEDLYLKKAEAISSESDVDIKLKILAELLVIIPALIKLSELAGKQPEKSQSKGKKTVTVGTPAQSQSTQAKSQEEQEDEEKLGKYQLVEKGYVKWPLLRRIRRNCSRMGRALRIQDLLMAHISREFVEQGDSFRQVSKILTAAGFEKLKSERQVRNLVDLIYNGKKQLPLANIHDAVEKRELATWAMFLKRQGFIDGQIRPELVEVLKKPDSYMGVSNERIDLLKKLVKGEEIDRDGKKTKLNLAQIDVLEKYFDSTEDYYQRAFISSQAVPQPTASAVAAVEPLQSQQTEAQSAPAPTSSSPEAEKAKQFDEMKSKLKQIYARIPKGLSEDQFDSDVYGEAWSKVVYVIQILDKISTADLAKLNEFVNNEDLVLKALTALYYVQKYPNLKELRGMGVATSVLALNRAAGKYFAGNIANNLADLISKLNQ